MGKVFGTIDFKKRKEKYSVIDKDIVEYADVCIIGSGAAGAVLAKELVESGRSVIVLERGGYYEGEDMNQRDIDMMALLWKNAGFQFDDDLRIAVAQGTCLGGSTIINDAVCFDPPPKVIKEWREMGVNFTKKEWNDHTKLINKSLSVSQVTPDELNKNNSMLKDGAALLQLQSHYPNTRNSLNCMQCGFCHFGCHYETKQDVLVTYLHKALRKPDSKIRIYCNCYVGKIDHSNGLVRGVEGTFKDTENNDTYRIRVNSKIVIISAGTIASSKLLLRNGISQDTAGRGVSLHPAPFVLGDFEEEVKGNQGIPMAYTVHDFGVTREDDSQRRKFGYQNDGEFLIEGIFLPLLQFSIALPGNIIEHNRLLQRFNHYAMAGILVRDEASGLVTLTSTNRASLRYSLSKKDIKTIANGVEVLSKMWFRMGAKRVIISHRNKSVLNSEDEISEAIRKVINEPDNLLLGSAHPQSGNKIGKDPKKSVVDADCKVHGFKNLFVCDASVFPTSLGVNPQITVMTIASIVAHRISKDWRLKFSRIKLDDSLGKTCSKKQPWYCLRKNLSEYFDKMETRYGAEMLVNDVSETPNDINWSIDPDTLEITNNTHWKGIFTRDTDPQNLIATYTGGFWKRFAKSAQDRIDGITHPFEFDIYAKNIAKTKQIREYGRSVLLEYTEDLYRGFFDVLKFVDKDTILGKAFFGDPEDGIEILTFSMTRKYPFEFMDEQDHMTLYNKMEKPKLEDMVGVWDGYLVSDSSWSPPVFRFKYFFDSEGKLKNHYTFGRILTGVATIKDNPDHVRMDDEFELFHDEIRQVNKDILIGKYISPSNELLNLIPTNITFLHSDSQRSRTYLPYVLKRIGEESAFREYTL